MYVIDNKNDVSSCKYIDVFHSCPRPTFFRMTTLGMLRGELRRLTRILPLSVEALGAIRYTAEHGGRLPLSANPCRSFAALTRRQLCS